jgi:hypothetical protein
MRARHHVADTIKPVYEPSSRDARSAHCPFACTHVDLADSTASSALFIPFPSSSPVPSASHPAIAPLSPASASRFEFQSQLSLASIRATLIRLEESIIFALIERAQFRRNEGIYKPIEEKEDEAGEKTQQPQQPQSLLSRFLASTESLHASVRRYTSPCEHPYSDVASLPQPILPQLNYPQTIKENGINHNGRIMQFYLSVTSESRKWASN